MSRPLQAIKPNFGKLNPVTGFKNLFGAAMFFEGGKAMTKVAAVGARGRDRADPPAHPTSARASARPRRRSAA